MKCASDIMSNVIAQKFEHTYVENKPLTDDETVEQLKRMMEVFSKRGNKKLAEGISAYLSQRNEYIKTHSGKYVQIYEGNIQKIEKTTLNDQDLGTSDKFYGLLLKVGNEVQEPDPANIAMYSENFSNHVNNYVVPVYFGYYLTDQWKLGNAIIDTGCKTTTFSLKVLEWIQSIYPLYSLTNETVYTVAGPIPVSKSTINIEFCGIKCPGHTVHFADIRVTEALIGMDILNRGKLDIDNGLRISFTHH